MLLYSILILLDKVFAVTLLSIFIHHEGNKLQEAKEK